MPSATDSRSASPETRGRIVSSAVAAGRRDGEARWGIALSAGLHLLLVTAALLSPPGRAPPPVPEIEMPVDIVTSEQYEAAVGRRNPDELLAVPPAPAASQPVPESLVAPPAPAIEEPDMIRPTRMLGQQVLADPRSGDAVAALATFAGSERMVQLCDIEAMEQLHAWRADLRPDQIVAYATERERVAGRTVIADGAAFRTDDGWSGLKFRCELNRGGSEVSGFAFLVGEPIPHELWEELGLPEGASQD